MQWKVSWKSIAKRLEIKKELGREGTNAVSFWVGRKIGLCAEEINNSAFKRKEERDYTHQRGLFTRKRE